MEMTRLRVNPGSIYVVGFDVAVRASAPQRPRDEERLERQPNPRIRAAGLAVDLDARNSDVGVRREDRNQVHSDQHAHGLATTLPAHEGNPEEDLCDSTDEHQSWRRRNPIRNVLLEGQRLDEMDPSSKYEGRSKTASGPISNTGLAADEGCDKGPDKESDEEDHDARFGRTSVDPTYGSRSAEVMVETAMTRP